MQLRDIMTTTFQTIGQGESVRRAAELMRDMDVGILPVVEENQLVGTVTDRDIAIRGIASGAAPGDMPVRDIMSRGVLCAYDDDAVESAAVKMEENQVRRLFVVDHDERCVGVVSLGDLAVRTQDASLSGEVLEEVSQPDA